MQMKTYANILCVIRNCCTRNTSAQNCHCSECKVGDIIYEELFLPWYSFLFLNNSSWALYLICVFACNNILQRQHTHTRSRGIKCIEAHIYLVKLLKNRWIYERKKMVYDFRCENANFFAQSKKKLPDLLHLFDKTFGIKIILDQWSIIFPILESKTNKRWTHTIVWVWNQAKWKESIKITAIAWKEDGQFCTSSDSLVPRE